MNTCKYVAIVVFAIAMQASAIVVAESDRPNLLIIVTDDQGYGDLSAYKHHATDVCTPNMDRIAAKGVLFTDAYVSAPVCSPSRAGWNTGQHQVRWDPQSSFGCGLAQNVPHIAEIMKANGYTTARVGKNDYGKGLHRRDVREDPLNHGYDEFLGFSAHGHDCFLLSKDIEKRTPDPKGHSAVVGPLMHNRGVKEIKDGYLTEIFTDAAIDFLERHGSESRQDFRSEKQGQSERQAAETLGECRYEKPFFLTLSYNSVHHLIHQSPRRYLDKYGVKEIPIYDPKMGSYAKWFQQYITLGKITADEMRRYYLANLNCLDDNIGRVLDALDEQSLADNTVVVFFSDNGGAPTTGACNRPLAGAKFSLWEGGIRVPFIAAWGKADGANVWQKQLPIPAGHIRQEIGVCYDLFPTIVEFVHAPVPVDHPIDGQDLSRLLTGQPDPNHRNEFLNHYPHPRRGQSHFFTTWRDGNWKVIYQYLAGGDDRYALYDLASDPSESHNLASEQPEKLRTMMQGMVRELEAMSAVYPVKDGQVLEPIIPEEKR